MGFRQDYMAYSYPRGACSGEPQSDPEQPWRKGSSHFLLETDSVVCGHTKGLALVINSAAISIRLAMPWKASGKLIQATHKIAASLESVLVA